MLIHNPSSVLSLTTELSKSRAQWKEREQDITATLILHSIYYNQQPDLKIYNAYRHRLLDRVRVHVKMVSFFNLTTDVDFLASKSRQN